MFVFLQAGLYIVEFFDTYVYNVAVPLMCLLETVSVMWLYGVHRFANNISDMTGSSESLGMKWMWKMCMPVFLIGILLLEFVTTGIFGVSHRLVPPEWLTAVGWLLSCLPPLGSILLGLYFLAFTKGPLKIRIKKLLHTPHSWGPKPSDDDDELPEYVISKPDVHRPVNALALLTANLYLPNFLDLTSMERRRESSDLSGTGYLSDLNTVSSSDDESSEDENKARGNWGGHFEFVFSCLGYVVGLGNVWRFPYLVYRNGGGAFFIPYLIMLIFCGLPLVYMELAFGQYASLGPITIWKAVPLFKGIGYAMVLVSGVLSIYYNMVNAWAVYYLFTSMTSVLPWQLCTNPWNTENCHENKFEVTNCLAINMSFVNTEEFMNGSGSCYSMLQDCQLHNKTQVAGCIGSLRDMFGDVVVILEHYQNRTSPSEEFFYRSMLDASPGLNSIGEIRWQLALCLLLCWGIVFVCLVKGIKSSGKISYLVVSFPYVIIMVLLIRGITMDGNLEGIRYYVTPRWELLAKPEVWADAATQVFFTLSACWGGLSTLSSYNKFHNNIYRDAILVCIGDTLMSVLAGFAVFAVIGVLSKELNTTVDKVIQTDVGLTFIVYPAAISYFPVSSLWSVLFFLMLVMMGLGTLFSSVETIVTAIIDEDSDRFKKKRIYILLVLCIVEFLLGLPLTSQGGIYIVQLMDEYLAGFPHMIIGIFMLIAISWVYGVKQFCSNVGHMIDQKVGWWWQAMWRYVSPTIIVFILVFSAVGYLPLMTKFDAIKYTTWSEGLGFLMAFICISPIPIYMLYKIISEKGTLIQRIKRSCQSDRDWGPALEKNWQYIDYYPTVHAAMMEAENSNIDTITDQVEFTTVGVRVPSLSQTSLLPISPNLPRTKKPMDMRQKAILNHAYSNPQCNLSTGSMEKLINRQCSSSEMLLSDVIIVPRVRRGTQMRDVATQTEASLLQKQSLVVTATKIQEEKKLRRVSWQSDRPQHLSLQCIRNEDSAHSTSSSSSQRYSWHHASDHEKTRHLPPAHQLAPTTRASSSRLFSPTRRSGISGLEFDKKRLQNDRVKEVSTSMTALKMFPQRSVSEGDAGNCDGSIRLQSAEDRSRSKDNTIEDIVNSDSPSVLLLAKPGSVNPSDGDTVLLLAKPGSVNPSDGDTVLQLAKPGSRNHSDSDNDQLSLPERQQSQDSISSYASVFERTSLNNIVRDNSDMMSKSQHELEGLPENSANEHCTGNRSLFVDILEHGVCQSQSLHVEEMGTDHTADGHIEDKGQSSASDSLIFSKLGDGSQTSQTPIRSLSWQHDGEPAVLEVEMTHL
ncbi:uncharacterized protein LOC121375829 [Gigantopelta aegis]|uniref:uncharacterized protein LOC121375829 n=1 Tax=Gigantopelta aegis TaxID=1735272 RepID=UPI001B887A93|nr:uncharacterized protein LOC121375829 [Gigantopelta aegis]